MNISIKKMETTEETKGKAYVHWKAWHEAYAGIVNQSYLDALTLEKCEDIAFQWPDNLLVAKNNDQIIGFAGFGKYRDDELENTGEIYAIYILEKYYGKGVGYKLMHEALTLLSTYSKVAVWVLKDNKRAISFYEKCGFKVDGREETIELGSPITEIRMVLSNDN